MKKVIIIVVGISLLLMYISFKSMSVALNYLQ